METPLSGALCSREPGSGSPLPQRWPSRGSRGRADAGVPWRQRLLSGSSSGHAWAWRAAPGAPGPASAPAPRGSWRGVRDPAGTELSYEQ